MIRLGPSNHPQALCGLPLGVSRLDHALGHKLHTMTENLHALSAHGPQFPGTLDLTGCSFVEVHGVRHLQQIRHRWRLSEPLRLPCRHRPVHVQTRFAQPPAPPPLVPPPRICSAQITNCTQRFYFWRSYGWSRLTQPGARPFQGAPRRLKPVDVLSSGSHVRKTKTPFFACSGMRPWTPVMAFLTDATPAHEFGNMKDPLPSKTTMLSLSTTPDTASKGLRSLAPWNVTRLEMSPPPCRSVRTFYRQFFQIVNLFTSSANVSLAFHRAFWRFKSTVGQPSGFTTDSPAPESTVISRAGLAHHLLQQVCCRWTCCHLWPRWGPPRQTTTLHHWSCRSVGLLLH